LVVHRGKYTYPENVDLSQLGVRTKIKIECPIHGEFQQTIDSHKQGSGCPKCRSDKNSNVFKKDWSYFLNKFEQIHGGKYHYPENVDLVNGQYTKIKIQCPIHGEYQQTIYNHSRSGCGSCGGTKKKTYAEVLESFENAHKDTYRYPKDVLLVDGVFTKIKIECPIHGEFVQTIDSHKQGSGCPKCRSSKLEKLVMKYLEYHNIEYNHDCKIDNCINLDSGISLRFDFYLIEYNILIECDGLQHFKPVSFSRDQSNITKCANFVNQVKLDMIKDVFCRDHDYKLLRIPYWEIDNIDDILTQTLNTI